MFHQLSQTTRVTRSRHTGRPILQELNTVYGYYATARFLDEDEYDALRSESPYDGPLHEAELRYQANLHIC